MLRFIYGIWYLRTRWLWHYARENPGHTVPGLIVLGALFLLNLSGVLVNVDGEMLKQYKGILHVSFFSSFGLWIGYGLVTGLRHGTVAWLQRLAPYPVSGPGLLIAHRTTAVLDPWFIMGLSMIPTSFGFFGVFGSFERCAVGMLGAVCLLNVSLSLVNLGESWVNRVMSRYLARFIAIMIVGCMALMPMFVNLENLLTIHRALYLPIVQILPSGIFLNMLFHLSEGQVQIAFETLISLIIYAVGLNIIEWQVIRRALAFGPPEGALSNGQTTNVLRRLDAILTHILPASRRVLAPFIAKDLVSFLRFPRLWVIPFLMIGIVFMNIRDIDLDAFGTGMMISVTGVFSCAIILVNYFGLDRMGGASYLLSPLETRDILLSKQISVWMLMIGQLVLVIVCLRIYLPAAFSLVQYYTLVLFNLYVVISAISFGSVTSVLFPQIMSTRKAFGSKGVPVISMVILIAFVIVSIIPAVLINMTISHDLYRLLCFFMLCLFGLVFYRLLFDKSVRILHRNRTSLFHAIHVEEEI
jgi:hypothetical protein